MSSGITREHEHHSHDNGETGISSARGTSPRSTYIQRMQDVKAPLDPRKDRARVLGSVLNGDDDSLLFSVQESFASSQPFVDDRNDYESRENKPPSSPSNGEVLGRSMQSVTSNTSAIVSVEDRRIKPNLKVICDVSVDSPIVPSMDGGLNSSNQKYKNYSAIMRSQHTSKPPLLEIKSTEEDLSDVDLSSFKDGVFEVSGRRANNGNEMKPEGNVNATDIENNRNTAADPNTDCGASLSVVLDDISIGGTTITSIVDSTNVIYDKDCDSTIKTEISQGQLVAVDDDNDDNDNNDNNYEALETVDDSKPFNEESIETVSMNRSVSWDPQVVSMTTKSTLSRTHVREVHSIDDSRQTNEFLSSNPHLFAIREDSTGAGQNHPFQTGYDDSDDDDKDSLLMVQCKSASGKICKYPKLLLVSCVVLLIIATVISAVFVSRKKTEDREQNITSLRGVDGEPITNESSSTPSFSSSSHPSSVPYSSPSTLPSNFPSNFPSMSPSTSPSTSPSKFPSMSPSTSPSKFPSISPSTLPTETPSFLPSSIPSLRPSMSPSTFPSSHPTMVPTTNPSNIPTMTQSPSRSPSVSKMPTLKPSTLPSLSPSLSARTKSITSIITSSANANSSLDLSMEQIKALSWVLYEDSMQIGEDDNGLLERYALYLVYDALNGSGWNDDESWLSTSHTCDWKFVLCNEKKSIYSLTLDDNNLNGTVPSEIGLFINIESISFDRNKISSTIPTEIGQLANLKYLSMKSNLLTGVLPDDIFQLGIKYLDVSSNNLSGKLSDKINGLSDLSTLLLSSNAFSGSIPREIGELYKLETLHMTNSLYNGSIPSEFGNLNNLKDLRLKENSLSGQIPIEIGNITSLETFSIYRNKLDGELPEELFKLNKLSDFRFFDNKLMGTLSSSIGQMISLVKFAGHSNDITGTIPSEIGMLTNLNLLYIYDNSLSGNIPKEVSNMKFLQKLSLSLNQLNGTIPETFENLTDISYLSLWSNSLSGTVPSALGNLVQLTALYLDGNLFQGSIPQSICALRNKSLSQLFSDCKEKVTCTCCTQCY